MNSMERKSAELLAECRDICVKNGYTYYLAPLTAANAYANQGFGDEYHMPSLLMPIEDALKFKKYVETNCADNRSIECMENSPHYSTFTLSYVNEDTTLVNMLRGSDFSKHGVRVIIEILRPVTSDKYLRFLETLWECTGFRRVLSVKRQNINKPSRSCVNLARKLGRTKSLYRRMCRKYSGIKSNKYLLKSYGMKAATIPAEIFKDTTTIKFEGEEYVVPSDVETYLHRATNGTWKVLLEGIYTNLKSYVFRYIFYENVPYRNIMGKFSEDGDNLNSYFGKYMRWFKNSDELVRYDSEKKRLWILAQRSGARAILFKKLSPRMDEIRELRAVKDFDKLEAIFAEYDKEVHRFLDLGLGLSLNQEFLDIECELMENRGEADKVQRLRGLVPERHYQSPFGE